MFKCPSCKASFKRFSFEGWITHAKGTAEIDDTGKVRRVGPLLISQSVVPGKEIDGKEVVIVCPNCRASAHREDYKTVYKCAFFDKEATDYVSVDIGAVLNDPGFVINLHLSLDGIEMLKSLEGFDPRNYVRD